MKTAIRILMFVIIGSMYAHGQTTYGVSGGYSVFMINPKLKVTSVYDDFAVRYNSSGYCLNLFAETRRGNTGGQFRISTTYNPYTTVLFDYAASGPSNYREEFISGKYFPAIGAVGIVSANFNFFDDHYFISAGGLIGTARLPGYAIQSKVVKSGMGIIDTFNRELHPPFGLVIGLSLSNGVRIPLNGRFGLLCEVTYLFQYGEGLTIRSESKVPIKSNYDPNSVQYHSDFTAGVFSFSAGIYIIPEFRK